MDQSNIAALFGILTALFTAHRVTASLINLTRIRYLRRRQNLRTLLASDAASNDVSGLRLGSKPKRFWTRPGRTSAWWDAFIENVVLPEEWRENFRMSKELFTNLVAELKPFIQRQATKMRKPISPEKQLGITLIILVMVAA